jgi:putative spermidine/putrescine transport system permease protein
MIKSLPGAKPRRRFDKEIFFLSLPALVAVLVLFVYPFIFGFDLSMRSGARGEGDWTLNNYSQFFNDARQVDSIWITFQVALPVTLFSAGLFYAPGH